MTYDNARAPHAQDQRKKIDRGVLFRNDRKSSDRDADYAGSINVGGVEYWLNAWVNESAKGTKYLSLSIKPKKQPAADKAAGGKPPTFGDEIPFAPEWRG